MEFETSEIARITEDACAMFGLTVQPDPPDQSLVEEELAGVIQIEGGWTGSVEMGCSPAFARRLAANLFAMDASEMSDEEVHDAFGELVNVTTGNIKALLPEGCRMGIPTVQEGLRLVNGSEVRVQHWGFDAEGDHLTVVVRQAA